MTRKGIHSAKEATFQLFILLLSMVIGAVVAAIISLLLTMVVEAASLDGAWKLPLMRSTQFLSATFTFLAPALVASYLFSDSPKRYLSIERIKDVRVWLLTLAGLTLFSPIINVVSLMNRAISLPEFMRPVELWMVEQEAMAERLTNMMIGDGGFGSIMANLIVMALTAAITEEFLFRGALQRILERYCSNIHMVIWLAAVIFSAIHLQFYGFIPRVLLGAYFGYLLYWSKSIWLPVFAHFINNSMAILAMSLADLKSNSYITGEIAPEETISYSILALACIPLFIHTNRLLKRIL